MIICASIFISFLYRDDIFVILNLVIWFGLIIIIVVDNTVTACGITFSREKNGFLSPLNIWEIIKRKTFYAFLIFFLFNFNDRWIYIVSIKSKNNSGSSKIGTQITHTFVSDIQYSVRASFGGAIFVCCCCCCWLSVQGHHGPALASHHDMITVNGNFLCL